MIKDGGPAFPNASDKVWDEHHNMYITSGDRGMSLRDWFAGQALAGIAGVCLKGSGMVCDAGRAKTVALCAYAYADAMLEARQKS